MNTFRRESMSLLNGTIKRLLAQRATSPGVESGPLWNAQAKRWDTQFVDLPTTETGKLLLVPKAIVRHGPDYDAGEYFRYYLLTHMQHAELDAGSALLEVLKNGRKRVTKKSLIKAYGGDKTAVVRQSLKHPDALKEYKDSKETKKRPPLSLERIAEIQDGPLPDWDALLKNVVSLTPGKADADRYEKAIEALFTALFYPPLNSPISQHPVANELI